MNDNFKNQLAAFLEDAKAICRNHPYCRECELGRDGCCAARLSSNAFDLEAVCAAVEAYRKHKKPCAEMIDRALDIYTIEVELERVVYSSSFTFRSAESYANVMAGELRRSFTMPDRSDSVRVLSAKRFVLESHREEEE